MPLLGGGITFKKKPPPHLWKPGFGPKNNKSKGEISKGGRGGPPLLGMGLPLFFQIKILRFKKKKGFAGNKRERRLFLKKNQNFPA